LREIRLIVSWTHELVLSSATEFLETKRRWFFDDVQHKEDSPGLEGTIGSHFIASSYNSLYLSEIAAMPFQILSPAMQVKLSRDKTTS